MTAYTDAGEQRPDYKKGSPEDVTMRAFDELVILAKDEVYQVDGLPTVIVKKSDGTHRKKPLTVGEEYFLKGCYYGKTTLVIVFTPVDAKEWVQIELKPTEVDLIFPTFTPTLAELVGAETERFADFLDYMRNRVVADDKAREEEEKRSFAETYENHPLFGRF